MAILDVPPDPRTRGALYNRNPPVVTTKLQYFLTDFITLRDWQQLPDFMAKGVAVRSWFEEQTGWRLVLSGHCVGDEVCADDHGRQILNLWRIETDNLDMVGKGLRRLGAWRTDQEFDTGNIFGALLDLVEKENHFITMADQRRCLDPKIVSVLVPDGWTFVFVYVEYWAPYGMEHKLSTSFGNPGEKDNIVEFQAPWQFIANVRALSGRVNTFSQYWLRPVPVGFDRDDLRQTVQREIKRAGWHRQKFRPMRVDVLTPTTYDPTTFPRDRRP